MSLPVVLRPLAHGDIQQIHDELEALTLGLGDKFVDRLDEALDRIEALPELYAEVWATVRAARLRRFRHVVYYVALADRVEVIAVMHGARDSSAWQSRV
ncbi:MAG: type II toxin-antitoxin system RelE/ParE family toxin [Gemmataceae bacterium]